MVSWYSMQMRNRFKHMLIYLMVTGTVKKIHAKCEVADTGKTFSREQNQSLQYLQTDTSAKPNSLFICKPFCKINKNTEWNENTLGKYTGRYKWNDYLLDLQIFTQTNLKLIFQSQRSFKYIFRFVRSLKVPLDLSNKVPMKACPRTVSLNILTSG